MASDGGADGPASRRRGVEQGYKWVSSSPSPAEVATLEACFPMVVQVPEPLLEEEVSEWKHRAVLARSFMRWVPAEAYIREFRRAGIPGAIIPICLSFSCYIFRFEDPGACELVLNRLWVVNGQIIGMEAWKSEFFPAADSISSSLVWMRLPNLPMEFWREDILRIITEPAGSFCGADSATQLKNRGGFAKVAVHVELLRPLRPGTRIQGTQGPFWQQFIYESVEGICPRCGSMHLVGSCSLASSSDGVVDDSGPVFGPWMAAVRQRRSVTKASPAAASSSRPASSPSSAPQPGSLSQEVSEGWQIPAKLARRRLPVSLKGASASQFQGGR